MANAKRCDFCNEFYIPEEESICVITFGNQYGMYNKENVKDTCPVCLRKMAEVFPMLNIYIRDKNIT